MGIADSVLKAIAGTPHAAADGLLEALSRSRRHTLPAARAVDRYVGVEPLVRGAIEGVKHPIRRLKGEDAPIVMVNGKPVRMMMGEVPFGPGAAARKSLARLVASKGQGGLVYSGGDIGFDRIAGVAKSGKARSAFVAEDSLPPSLLPPIDDASLDRMAALVHPRGERVLVGQPGLHHHDVARGAGLRDYEGWAQMEIRKGDPDFNIPARLFTTNGIGPQPNPRQIAATSRFLKKAKGVRYAPMHR